MDVVLGTKVFWFWLLCLSFVGVESTKTLNFDIIRNNTSGNSVGINTNLMEMKTDKSSLSKRINNALINPAIFHLLNERFGNTENELAKYIVEIDAMNYVDISGANDTLLELNYHKLDNMLKWNDQTININSKGNKHSLGITTLDGEDCTIETLIMKSGFVVSPNITLCKDLKNVIMKGSGWTCGSDWRWLIESDDILFETDCSQATCGDIKHNNPPSLSNPNQPVKQNKTQEFKFLEGRQELHKLKIECPKECIRCSTIIDGENVAHRVDCDGKGISDETLPRFSAYTTDLFLDNNQLTSNVFHQLKYLRNLRFLNLQGNKLDALPYFKAADFPKLRNLYLNSNEINKIDLEAFKSMINRDILTLHLYKNNFVCDCNAHFFMKLCLENSAKIGQLLNYPLECTPPFSSTRQLIRLRPDECENSPEKPISILPIIITVLALLNCLFLYFMYDLVMAIKECQVNSAKPRNPKIHLIMKAFQQLPNFLLKKCSQKKEIETASVEQDLHTVTLRNPSVAALGDPRISHLMRHERRRLTPGPS